MEDEFYEKQFNPFFLQLCIINVKTIMQKQLTKDQIKFCADLKYIIPIFNRLNEDKMTTIEQIMNDGMRNKVQPEKKEDVNEEKPEEIDLDGDKLVEDWTTNSLKMLNDIKKNKWMTTICDYEADSE